MAYKMVAKDRYEYVARGLRRVVKREGSTWRWDLYEESGPWIQGGRVHYYWQALKEISALAGQVLAAKRKVNAR